MAWRVMGELELFTFAELTHLYAAAREHALPGDVRRAAHRLVARDRLGRPEWHVIETDRDGRPVDRAWVVSALPGTAVFHRGTYSIWYARGGAYRPSGIETRTLAGIVERLIDMLGSVAA